MGNWSEWDWTTNNASPDQPRDEHGRWTTVGMALRALGLSKDTPWQVAHDDLMDRGRDAAAAHLKMLAHAKKVRAWYFKPGDVVFGFGNVPGTHRVVKAHRGVEDNPHLVELHLKDAAGKSLHDIVGRSTTYTVHRPAKSEEG